MALKRKVAAGLLAAVPALAGCDAEATTEPGLEVAVHSLLGGLEPGETYALSGEDARKLLLTGGDDGAEYLIVPFYGIRDETSELALEILGNGVGATPAPTLARAPERAGTPLRALGAIGARAARSGPGLAATVAGADRAHQRLRSRMRAEAADLMRRGFSHLPNRAALLSARREDESFAPAAVGDLLEFNTQADSACTAPRYRTGRVMAISDRAIVVADTLNPENGFTTADYEGFADEFDALIHPVVSGTFGEPSDIDGNGKVIIFFTSAVNELTPPGSEGVVAGFFYGRDLFPRVGTERFEGCAGSNEAEIFYMLVPDPERAQTEPIFSREEVAFLTMGTIAHEYQHLINAARRMYVNGASAFEDGWLDEALSHVAEELTFYEASGMGPGQDIDLGALVASERRVDAANRYLVPNLVRYGLFLQEVEQTSIFEFDLQGRGASWSFLRYAADRSGMSDEEFFGRLANATTAGITNLGNVAGADVFDLARDWTISIYADNLVPGLDARFRQPSWDFRSILPELFPAVGFPLTFRTFGSDRSENLALKGGGTAFLTVTVDAATRASLETSTTGGALPNGFKLSVLRVK
ncbi:MAG TPA: hypothetical protein VF158_01750 [Longimicrobiales bacterium]